MTKQITRTVKTYTIHASTVKSVDGKLETTEVTPVIIKDETVTEENAVKYVQKAHGKKAQYVVTEIEVSEVTYAVPFDVFMEHAKKIEKHAQENTENNTPATQN